MVTTSALSKLNCGVPRIVTRSVSEGNRWSNPNFSFDKALGLFFVVSVARRSAQAIQPIQIFFDLVERHS